MVKVREFCCGSSLRTGTLIIAWGLLVYSCILLLLNTVTFAKEHRRRIYYGAYYDEEDTPSPFILAYDIIRFLVGIAVSIIAIWSLHKDKVKFLNGLFWYLCYYAVVTTISEIILILVPTWELKLAKTNPMVNSMLRYMRIEDIMAIFFVYLFIIGIVSYFALVVKSCRDYSLKNETRSNPEFSSPDPTYVGFRQC